MFEIGRPRPGGGRFLDVDGKGGGGRKNQTIFMDVICVSIIPYFKRSRLTLCFFFTSMVYTLFKSKFASSPLRFSIVQWLCGHQESAVLKTVDIF